MQQRLGFIFAAEKAQLVEGRVAEGQSAGIAVGRGRNRVGSSCWFGESGHTAAFIAWRRCQSSRMVCARASMPPGAVRPEHGLYAPAQHYRGG